MCSGKSKAASFLVGHNNLSAGQKQKIQKKLIFVINQIDFQYYGIP